MEHIPRGLPPLTVARWLPPGAALPDMLVVAVTITLVGHCATFIALRFFLSACSAVIDPATCAQTVSACCVCYCKVGLMESIAIAKSLADMHRHELDPSQELLGERRRPAARGPAVWFMSALT